MTITDHLPKYPNVRQVLPGDPSTDLLNPYMDEGFYSSLYHKKEFYDQRLEANEPFPTEKGVALKAQKIIARFLSSRTPYDALLVIHEMGTGKTCSAIAAIEQIKGETDSQYKGAYIFAKGRSLLNNFVTELRDKCTAGQYVPLDVKEEDTLKMTIRTRKLIGEYYNVSIGSGRPTTFETFSTHLSGLTDADIVEMYSNYILVIDEVHNLRIKDVTTEDVAAGVGAGIGMYAQFHRMLHLVKNTKVILLSGTPMKDSPAEIASVLNLINPMNRQLPTSEQFLTRFFDQTSENSYTIRPEMIDVLKTYSRGRVSYLQAMKVTTVTIGVPPNISERSYEVPKVYVGETMGTLKHFKVDPVVMSKHQTNGYTTAMAQDTSGEAGVYIGSRQASLFVFPDGSCGQPKIRKGKSMVADKTRGFAKFVLKKRAGKKIGKKKDNSVSTYSLSPEMIELIKGNDDEETLKNLRKYSAKYARVIGDIINSPRKKAFVYCEFVQGSGCILFAEILKLFSFSAANADSNKMSDGKRYALLTNMTSTPSQIGSLIKLFNSPDNTYGEKIKVIIGSRLISEGVSFSEIQKEYIMTPWFNYSETDQAIARGYRLGSHRVLIGRGEDPHVDIYQTVCIPRTSKNKVTPISVDLYMYEISEDKDVSIRGVLRVMQESAVDCGLTYFRNIGVVDGSRDCNYTTCEYECDGLNMDEVRNGLDEEDLDTSTYNIYYADSRSSTLRRRIDNLFKKHTELTSDTIVEYFDGDYSENEIRNALKMLTNRIGESLNYTDYVQTYSRTSVRAIQIAVEDMFRTHFRIGWENIIDDLPEYSEFEIKTALKNLIDGSVVIKNRYGFNSYLREHKNIFFLVDSLSVGSDPFSEYYARVPNLVNTNTFTEDLLEVQKKLLPKYIETLCKATTQVVFNRMIKSVPVDVQEAMIEQAIVVERERKRGNKVKGSKKTARFLLDYFASYIHDLGKDRWVSNLLADEDTVRCLDKKWTDCDDADAGALATRIEDRRSVLESNPYGYYGKYNPATDTFSIVNVHAQKEAEKKTRDKRVTVLTKLVTDNKMTQIDMDAEIATLDRDFRDVFPGKACAKGWPLPHLLHLALNVLKFDVPDDYRPNDRTAELRALVHGRVSLVKAYSMDPTADIETLDKTELRKALYWSDRKKGQTVKPLCVEIERWMRSHEWRGESMLIPDNQAGVSGGHVKKAKTVVEAHAWRMEKYRPTGANRELFTRHVKDIEKLVSSVLGVTYRVNTKSPTEVWSLVFMRKKLVAVLIIEPSGRCKICCVQPSYTRRLGMAESAIKFSLTDTCVVKKPSVVVKNTDKIYKKLLKTYIKYGFEMSTNNGTQTILQYPCV